MRILFQGDSITDAGRKYEDYHELGQGYPKYAAELIRDRFDDPKNGTIEFINQREPHAGSSRQMAEGLH